MKSNTKNENVCLSEFLKKREINFNSIIHDFILNGDYYIGAFFDEDNKRNSVRYKPSSDIYKLNPVYPEMVDIKITNNCSIGCKWCYQNSIRTKGIDGDFDFIKETVEQIPSWVELACLDGETVVFTENGAIDISELKIGDMIFDNEHKLRKITKINKTLKDVYNLKASKGINIKCSDDHPFMSNNIQIKAKDIIEKKLDFLEEDDYNSNEKVFINFEDLIKKRNINKKGSVGGRDFGEKVRIRNSSPVIPKEIEVTPDLMWLYGLFIAEGSCKGFALHINETHLSDRITKIWKETFNLNTSIYQYPEKNSMTVELQTKTLIEDLFVKKMEVGIGAKNKSLSYLFKINNKELIRQALLGMIAGDGCFRYRKNSIIMSYKTTSKKLAFEMQYLFAKHFNVFLSNHYGISKERKIKGRLLKDSEYYMLEIYSKDEIKKVFYDVVDIPEGKCPQKRTLNQKVKELISLNKKDCLYDITLEKGSHIFPINGFILTHNCGGGDPLEYNEEKRKELFLLIDRFYSRNFTINIKSIEKSLTNKRLKEALLEYFNFGTAIGISIENTNDLKIMNKALLLFNLKNMEEKICYHLIPDLLDEKELHTLINEISNTKSNILLLGYKTFGRGINYQKYTRKHNKEKLLKIISSCEKNNKNFFVKIDTKFAKDYDLDEHLHEGEFSCNIDACTKRVTASSWEQNENDNTYHSNDFKKAFALIRKKKGF